MSRAQQMLTKPRRTQKHTKIAWIDLYPLWSSKAWSKINWSVPLISSIDLYPCFSIQKRTLYQRRPQTKVFLHTLVGKSSGFWQREMELLRCAEAGGEWGRLGRVWCSRSSSTSSSSSRSGSCSSFFTFFESIYYLIVTLLRHVAACRICQQVVSCRCLLSVSMHYHYYYAY